MYLSKKRFYGGHFDVRILISESAKNDVQQKNMLDEFDFFFDEYSEELLREILNMIEMDKEDRRYLLLIDDAMSEKGIKQNRFGKDAFTSMITRYRHIGSKVLETEGRLSVCLALQYYKFLTSTLRNQIQGFFILGELPDSELKKIADDYSFMGGDRKNFMELFNKTRKEEFDFTYMNVPNMEMYRNFDELVWSKKEKSKDNISEDEKHQDASEDSEETENSEEEKDTDRGRTITAEAKKVGKPSKSKGGQESKKGRRKKGRGRGGRTGTNRLRPFSSEPTECPS